jgi:hypothetical protein
LNLFRALLGERTIDRCSGIVDQHIDAPEFCDECIDNMHDMPTSPTNVSIAYRCAARQISSSRGSSRPCP